MSYKSLQQESIGLVFSVGLPNTEEAYPHIAAIQNAAYARIATDFAAAFATFERRDTSVSEDFAYVPLELCQNDGEIVLEHPRPEMSVWFVSASTISLQDAQRLRALCATAYAAVAAAKAGTDALFERAERHQVWHVSESSTFEGV